MVTISCYWEKHKNQGFKTKPKLGVHEGDRVKCHERSYSWKNSSFWCQNQTKFLPKCSRDPWHLVIWHRRRAVCSVIFVQIYLSPFHMKGVNTQRVIPARGRLLIVQAALTHSIFLKYRKYAVLSWLMGTCTWFLSFCFSLFLWNQRSCFPLLWFNSLNPFLFVCPWYHRRKSCPRGRKTLNNSKKSSQPQWRGDIELAGTWPRGFNSSACFFSKTRLGCVRCPSQVLMASSRMSI